MFASLADMVTVAEEQGQPLSEVVLAAELTHSRKTRD